MFERLVFFQDFHSIYKTPKITEDEEGGWKEYLQAAVLFLALAPHDNHQQDMMFRVAKYPQLEQLPAYKVNSNIYTKYIRYIFILNIIFFFFSSWFLSWR